MQIDTVAMVQGIHNALAKEKISEEFHRELVNVIYSRSEPGPVRRQEISLENLFLAILDVDHDFWPWHHWSYLWEELGESIASGIGVANSCRKEGE